MQSSDARFRSESIPESFQFWLESESNNRKNPGIGIGIRKINRNRNQAFRVSLESESGFWSKPGIGIGIRTLPESCITDAKHCQSTWSNYMHNMSLYHHDTFIYWLIISIFFRQRRNQSQFTWFMRAFRGSLHWARPHKAFLLVHLWCILNEIEVRDLCCDILRYYYLVVRWA